MNDLTGLDWNSKPTNNLNSIQQQSRPILTQQYQSTPIVSKLPAFNNLLQPQSSIRPQSSTNSLSTSPVKSTKDSFSSLLGTQSSTNGNTAAKLTLQERQSQLVAEQQLKKNHEAQLWNSLGRGNGGSKSTNGKIEEVKGRGQSIEGQNNSRKPELKSINGSAMNGHNISKLEDDDDDIFGLGTAPLIKSNHNNAKSTLVNEDDTDILGSLSRPVEHSQSRNETVVPKEQTMTNGKDKAVAELVDMGFLKDQAVIALIETNNNVQAAVGLLLNQAHAEAQAKSKGKTHNESSSPTRQNRDEILGARPSWMQPEIQSTNNPQSNSRITSIEQEVQQKAVEVGTALFKSANILWKAGKKQVQKAVVEFQHQHDGGDSSQPRWMRDAMSDNKRSESLPATQKNSSYPSSNQTATMTNEAMLLETDGYDSSKRPNLSPKLPNEPIMPLTSRGRSPAQVLPERSAFAPFTSSQERASSHGQSQARQTVTKLSRDQVEQQASQVYVSSARRRKPQVVTPEPEVDLFSTTSLTLPVPSSITVASRTTSVPTKPKIIQRNIPSVNPTAMSQSSNDRTKGNEAFKRGDYDAAHQKYTDALDPLPSDHPIVIILLCNRALTAIKTGDPKMAISDADRALTMIGSNKGEGEMINLDPSQSSTEENNKSMSEYYSKALMRKAEALEAMEKYSDALSLWKSATENNIGGIIAIRGKERCLKACGQSTLTTSPIKKSASVPSRMKSTITKPSVVNNAQSVAVANLRAIEAGQTKLEEEQFALSDSVSARLDSWKAGGRGDNLRTLLGSLDNVLWPGADWKKLGMSELVLPGKVKICYMKAVAKVHPDKVRLFYP